MCSRRPAGAAGSCSCRIKPSSGSAARLVEHGIMQHVHAARARHADVQRLLGLVRKRGHVGVEPGGWRREGGGGPETLYWRGDGAAAAA